MSRRFTALLAAAALLAGLAPSVFAAGIATDDAYSVDEDAALSVDAPSGVLVNDVPPILVTAELVGGPSHEAVFSLNGDGSFTYTPEANFHGTDAFTYLTRDALSDPSNTATVTITVDPVNDTPVTSGQSVSATEDVNKGIALVATDVDGGNIDFTPTEPAHGTVALGAKLCSGTPSSCTQNVTFDPDPNYNGSDSFTFTVTDGTSTSDPATVTITIAAVQDAPSAANDPLAAVEDGSNVTIDPRGNDVEVDGQSLAVTAVTQGAKGAVTFTAGSVTYNPAANAFGADAFTYTVSDGNGGTDTATVNVTIAAVNDPPVIGRPWRLAVAEDSGPASFPVRTVMSAGPGESAQTLTLSVVGNSNPSLFSSQPSVVRTSYGLRVAFTPAANRNGWALITVRLSDGGLSTDRSFRIRVVPLNDPPNAVNDLSFSVARNAAAKPLAVLANDTAAPDSGESLTITARTNGAHGTVTITGGGTGLTYKPATGFSGTDSFTYTISDGNGGFDTATVVVTVNP